MFKSKKTHNALGKSDEALLIESMQKIISGDFSKVDVSTFNNPETGELFNQMLTSFDIANNPYVMRLNNAMQYIANSENIMQMIEQLHTQDGYVKDMQNSSQELDSSVNHISSSVESIKDRSHNAVTISKQSVDNMTKSISVVEQSAQQIMQINDMIVSFQEKTNKIHEIVDIVKKIANKSGLLALNASIEAARAGEAGKGFSVVANQVKDLSNNTTASAEDIVKYVSELQENMQELVESINVTSAELQECTSIVQESVTGIITVNEQMDNITDDIDGIYENIKVQNNVTDTFLNCLSQLSSSYDILSDGCIKTGAQMFRITRSVDKVRSDMARNAAQLYPIDWIDVFEIDHIIFTWRIYNNLAGYEKLQINQVNNPDGCKLGKWIGSQNTPAIINSEAFKELKRLHYELHKHAVDTFNSNVDGNRETALLNFEKTRATLPKLVEQLHKIKELKAKLGESEYTKIDTSLV